MDRASGEGSGNKARLIAGAAEESLRRAMRRDDTVPGIFGLPEPPLARQWTRMRGGATPAL